MLENFIVVHSYETENRLAEIRDVLPKRKRVIPSTNMITNIPAPDHLEKFLCHLQCFFQDQRKKDGSDIKPDTMSSFQKTPASHWRANTYSALSFDLIRGGSRNFGLGGGGGGAKFGLERTVELF